MPRTVSTTFWEALSDAATAQDLHVLLTITHTDLAQPIRVCSDVEDITSNGNLFVGFPFEFVMPNDTDALPIGRIRIQNVDRQMSEAIKGLRKPPRMLVEGVLRSSPDIVEFAYNHLVVRNIQIDAATITGDIGSFDYSTLPYPRTKSNKTTLPGLFV